MLKSSACKMLVVCIALILLSLLTACACGDTPTPSPDPGGDTQPAEQTYTLKFNSNGGSAIADASWTLRELQEHHLPLAERAGYSFEGWFTDEALTVPFAAPQSEPQSSVIELYAKWEMASYTVNVEFSTNKGFTTTGKRKQVVSLDSPFQPLTVKLKENYVLYYYQVGEERFNSTTIELPEVYEDTTVFVHIDHELTELPRVNIQFTGTIDSRDTYTPMTFSVENCDGELSGVAGGIRLRGNSTMNDSFISKLPYRIKFDQKQSLFGLEAAKSWVLLADYLDPSGLHNHAALTLGNASDAMKFTPTPIKVNVYFNGEYHGLYTMCEQIQENAGRLDIKMETDPTTGFLPTTLTDLKDYNFLICMNKSVAEGDTTEIYNETYFRAHKDGVDYYFELKYPEKEDFATEEQFQNYFDQIKAYVRSLFHDEDGAVPLMDSGSYEELSAVFDMKSLVDYYIVDSIMMEKDHEQKSFNMFYTAETGKIHFGPIWDYDYCLNLKWSFKPNNTYYSDTSEIYYSNHFFKMIERFPELQELLRERYNAVFKPALQEYIDSFDTLANSISVSLAKNEEKWYSSANIAYKGISENNIKFLKRFLTQRKSFLDETWKLN